jgi:hypothetical protein
MTRFDDDLDPQLPVAERDELLQVAARLEGGRPAPLPAFRGELGRAVSAVARARHLRPRPEHLWLLVALLVLAGAVLLLAAAAQL